MQESCWPQWEGVVCVPSSRVGHQVFAILGICYLAIRYLLFGHQVFNIWGICYLAIRYLLQSGASSLAKHGGAYFSAVYGSLQDPIAAPGLFDIQVP